MTRKKIPTIGPDGTGTILAFKRPPQLDQLHRKPAELIEFIESCIPDLKGKIEPSTGEQLANRSASQIEEILSYFIHAANELNEAGMQVSLKSELLPNINEILKHDVWKVEQLYNCVVLFEGNDLLCHLFLSEYIPRMSKNVYWKPFIDKLLEFDDKSALAQFAFLGGTEVEKYIKQWDNTVVMADEAIHHFGLRQVPELELGVRMDLEIDPEGRFATNASGLVIVPPYVNEYETKGENMTHWLVSHTHEMGHHRWGTFTVSMHPDIFDYDGFGVKYVGHEFEGEKLVITVEKEGTRIKIKKFDDIFDLVESPGLLGFLHNVLDDGRIDANNITHYAGIAADYRKDCEHLFLKRKLLSGANLDTLLEAILQYAIMGKLRGTIPEKLENIFDRVKHHINHMEIGIDTNGTSSLNAAIKIYKIIEAELKNESKKFSSEHEPSPLRPSKTKIDGKNSPKITMQIPKRGDKGRPGVYTIIYAKKPEESKPEQGGTTPNVKPAPGQTHLGGKPVPKPRIAIYDGFDGEKFVAGEHVVHEENADGPEILPTRREAERIATIFRKYAPRRGVLVRGLAEGEHDDELFEAWCDQVASGILAEEKYYSAVVYEERDVATGVLVDLSGSTMAVRPQILQATTILTTASDILRDPLIVAGLSFDDGKERFIVMNGAQEKKLRSSNASGGTPIGGPLRHMCAKMKERGIKHKNFKQLFVITDGAANVGKNPIDDAAEAVQKARKDRINIFGIGIVDGEVNRGSGPAEMRKYLEKVFGIGRYLIVSSTDVNNGYLHRYFEGYYRKTVRKIR